MLLESPPGGATLRESLFCGGKAKFSSTKQLPPVKVSALWRGISYTSIARMRLRFKLKATKYRHECVRRRPLPAAPELVCLRVGAYCARFKTDQTPRGGVRLVLRMASRTMCKVTDITCETRVDVEKVSYTWTVRNFSLRREETGEKVVSSKFSMPKFLFSVPAWFLHLYPNGEDAESEGYVSLYLFRDSECSSLFYEYKLALLDKAKREVCVQKTTAPIPPGGRWGFSKFIEKDCLLKSAESLLVDDTLTIYCEVLSFCDSVYHRHGKAAEIHVPGCRLSQDLGHLLESRQFSDVILSVEGQEIHAHKGILAARSPVFAAMFKHEMKENELDRVQITDCDFEVLNEVVDFIYTGRAPKLDEMAEEVLFAADKYDLGRLKAMCEDVLCSKLSVETAAKILVLADMHSADQLRASALRFIKAHAALVAATDSWKMITTEKPQLVAEAFSALALGNVFPM
ncbi:hypothetical protein HPB48_017720 [Haemaphysalis longicornis]|uniref:Speckle-type POZ protein n=1 Tax=Haemaphysalis longicornis TaxID=44386 RepID=A0A9J6FNW1_HAELO|nr:hypothetical protein HPB48_017720 [Haemaphysalis longicornis]